MSQPAQQPIRPYIYYDTTISVCSQCLRKVDAKIVFQDDQVFMNKRCPTHGWERVLIADDIEYYKRARETFLKVPEQPLRQQSPIRYGCPYDCGLCADHEQHSCVCVVEINDACNLTCPTCYASSGTHRTTEKSLEEVEKMLDILGQSEAVADVVQISGGEPTIHSQFFEILDAAKARPIRHLMVNTNGIRIAKDPEFAKKLASYQPGFELYLQFDSFRKEALEDLRGADLRKIRKQAIDRCNELDLSVTLVVTVKKGVNDDELGEIVEYALKQPSVRGVTFQPVQHAGRCEEFDPATDRLTLSEVRTELLKQSDVFAPADVLPVPCHPDAIAMAYALKIDDQVIPLTHMIPDDVLVSGASNTISFEHDPATRDALFDLFSTHHSETSRADSLKELLCCIPKLNAPKEWGYRNLFRVIIMEFIDAHNFDVRSVKRSCVHFVQSDGRIIPFDTYNLFYRDELTQTVLEPIRAELEPGKNFPPAPKSVLR